MRNRGTYGKKRRDSRSDFLECRPTSPTAGCGRGATSWRVTSIVLAARGTGKRDHGQFANARLIPRQRSQV
ncbi:hypothetical protein VTK73DRAFT_9005 [Phialemonium thermophilum]|uniref:Uncharacterized protein n=1 Tax=Phialemonium thermophilum TaxID=223376 RepID=A0ABR3W5H2_9PEZI